MLQHIAIQYVSFILAVPPILLLISYLLIKILESKKKHCIIDTETNAPLKNSESLLTCLTERMSKKFHLYELNYQRAIKYNFENFQGFIGHMPFLVISNVEDAKRVLFNWKEFPKAAGLIRYPYMDQFLGQNLVFVNHEQWRMQRSIMNPAFYNIDRFSPLFAREAFKCIKGMQSFSDQFGVLTVPVAEFTTGLALDVLGLAAFKYEFNLLTTASKGKHNNTSSEYIDAYHYVIANLSDIKFVMGGKWYPMIPIEQNRKMQASIAKMNDLVYSLIEKAKQNKLKNAGADAGEESLLDMMIDSTDEESGKKFTEEELRSNILIFFLAGHDTTSASLAAALYSIAKNPRVQNKLIEEIDTMLGKDLSIPLDIEAVKNLQYLGWVIKETLRMYPPVVTVPGRTVQKNNETIGNIKLKKGSLIGISIYNIHHNPAYWNEPMEFRPERFSEEESKGRPSMAWIPFGGGARLCIGNNFSLLEQRIFLSALLQRYTIELPNPKAPYKFLKNGILMSPDPTMLITFKPRQPAM